MPIKPTKNNDGNRRRERGDQTRVNERIRAPRVRVVTANGDQLGVMNTRDALEKAKALGLDLVEVAGNADPPVCRVVDYGRYKYQQSKLQKNNKSRTIKLKEVKLRIGTDTNDYNVKLAVRKASWTTATRSVSSSASAAVRTPTRNLAMTCSTRSLRT